MSLTIQLSSEDEAHLKRNSQPFTPGQRYSAGPDFGDTIRAGGVPLARRD